MVEKVWWRCKQHTTDTNYIYELQCDDGRLFLLRCRFALSTCGSMSFAGFRVFVVREHTQCTRIPSLAVCLWLWAVLPSERYCGVEPHCSATLGHRWLHYPMPLDRSAAFFHSIYCTGSGAEGCLLLLVIFSFIPISFIVNCNWKRIYPWMRECTAQLAKLALTPCALKEAHFRRNSRGPSAYDLCSNVDCFRPMPGATHRSYSPFVPACELLSASISVAVMAKQLPGLIHCRS